MGNEISSKLDILHIYGQTRWHNNAYIVGNVSSLQKLLSAVISALLNKKGTCNMLVNDGEEYALSVVCIEDAQLDKLAVPYISNIAEEKSSDALWPWIIIEKIEQSE